MILFKCQLCGQDDKENYLGDDSERLADTSSFLCGYCYEDTCDCHLCDEERKHFFSRVEGHPRILNGCTCKDHVHTWTIDCKECDCSLTLLKREAYSLEEVEESKEVYHDVEFEVMDICEV